MKKKNVFYNFFKTKTFFDFIIKKTFNNTYSITSNNKEIKENLKYKKFLSKEQETVDIWSLSEQPLLNDKEIKTAGELNLKEDILKEVLGFKLKKSNKSGRRTPKELWQRIKYLSKGLTLSEWADRVEVSWENMLEYTEKVWENFFIYSFKKYSWYPYLNKYWADSWYGQNWRNWRREEDTITWQINSRTPWNKHLRLSNDFEMLNPKQTKKRKIGSLFTFPEMSEKHLGQSRLHLKNQSFTNSIRHERIKQGVYNTEKFTDLNGWDDTANIYLKYIRPWLMRLNYLDKNVYKFQPLGKEQHQKNYTTTKKKNIFQKEFFYVAYSVKLIKQLKKANLTAKEIEKKFGKRNLNLYIHNQHKLAELKKYEQQLALRRTNVNLIKIKKYQAGLSWRPLNLNFAANALYKIINNQNMAS